MHALLRAALLIALTVPTSAVIPVPIAIASGLHGIIFTAMAVGARHHARGSSSEMLSDKSWKPVPEYNANIAMEGESDYAARRS